MSWKRIRLIFDREIRDQLRDRRTMFTIFVLPLVLYPLMGMLMLQVAQFHSEQQVRIEVDGIQNWEQPPSPLNDLSLSPSQPPSASPTETNLIQWNRINLADDDADGADSTKSSVIELAKGRLVGNQVDLVLSIPPEFPSQRAIIVYNQTSDRSIVAANRVRGMIEEWHKAWVRRQLNAANLDAKILDRAYEEPIDIAPPATKQALVWSKLLPLVMLVWALTGAFYPAIDLCAGEKERGTLETLLSSPATRREIVWGKLMTVTCFSIGTALLNLFSMQLTSAFVIRQFTLMGNPGAMEAFGPLSWSSITWLIVILLPIATMFSGLALAVAALARSSKEGQYYLMPLLLVGLPLVMLPMMPGMTLTHGTSLIPVTGAVLLSRTLIEGQYTEAISHAPFVIAVTIVCCLLAVRWASRQFESESVLFRESDRFQVSSWLRSLLRHKHPTATANQALLCGVLILIVLFYGRMSIGTVEHFDWSFLVRSTIAIQLGLILAPCLIMAIILTTSVKTALGLNLPRWRDFLMVMALPVLLHPAYLALAGIVQSEFQLGQETRSALVELDHMISSVPLVWVVLVLAVVPAVCEELAFRGFIFNGLSKQDGTLRAILVSSILFGLSHSVLQQSITATLMGLLIGVIAWKTGSVVCCIAFHVIHNSLTMSVGRLATNIQAATQEGGNQGWSSRILQALDGTIFTQQTRSIVDASTEGVSHEGVSQLTATTDSLAYTDAWMVIGLIIAVWIVSLWFVHPKKLKLRFQGLGGLLQSHSR